nr:hypothetical protein [Pseudomonas sp. BIGb0427]
MLATEFAAITGRWMGTERSVLAQVIDTPRLRFTGLCRHAGAAARGLRRAVALHGKPGHQAFVDAFDQVVKVFTSLFQVAQHQGLALRVEGQEGRTGADRSDDLRKLAA